MAAAAVLPLSPLQRFLPVSLPPPPPPISNSPVCSLPRMVMLYPRLSIRSSSHGKIAGITRHIDCNHCWPVYSNSVAVAALVVVVVVVAAAAVVGDDNDEDDGDDNGDYEDDDEDSDYVRQRLVRLWMKSRSLQQQ